LTDTEIAERMLSSTDHVDEAVVGLLDALGMRRRSEAAALATKLISEV
jgi:DNA-binding NarL/FixJ family response regulator